MAISKDDIAALPDYTDAELLKLYRWGLANGAAGTSRTIGGRSITFPSVKDLKDMIVWLEGRVSDVVAAAAGNGGVALAVFEQPA